MVGGVNLYPNRMRLRRSAHPCPAAAPLGLLAGALVLRLLSGELLFEERGVKV
jgi:hypothetical protein